MTFIKVTRSDGEEYIIPPEGLDEIMEEISEVIEAGTRLAWKVELVEMTQEEWADLEEVLEEELEEEADPSEEPQAL